MAPAMPSCFSAAKSSSQHAGADWLIPLALAARPLAAVRIRREILARQLRMTYRDDARLEVCAASTTACSSSVVRDVESMSSRSDRALLELRRP
jgi:hypothetical protein